MKGKLFVVTGPSGAGKDSVIDKARVLGLDFGSVTTTSTRPMRSGEAEGSPYYYITSDEFEKKVKNSEMIEWAEVYGNFYGSTKEEVERAQKKHDVVIIKVDPQGARTYKKIVPEAVSIFIKPPSFEYLEKRLINRASDSPEVIKKRLNTAQYELQNLDFWDYVVVNKEGELDGTAEKLIDIVNKEVREPIN